MTDRSHMGTQILHSWNAFDPKWHSRYLDVTTSNNMLVMSLNRDVWFVVSQYHMMGWFSVPAPFDWLCVGHTKQRSMDTFPKFILSFCWTHSICKEQMIARLSRMNRGTATGTRSKEAILQPLSTHKKKKKKRKKAASALQHAVST